MGKIASDFADSIILTNDNPRFENPQKIRRDIKKGIKKKRIVEISNRANAITQAVYNLNSGDILLVAGKGLSRQLTKYHPVSYTHLTLPTICSV